MKECFYVVHSPILDTLKVLRHSIRRNRHTLNDLYRVWGFIFSLKQNCSRTNKDYLHDSCGSGAVRQPRRPFYLIPMKKK